VSDQTKAALETAIEAHMADESPGAVVGAYILIAETTGITDVVDDVSTSRTESRGSAFTKRGLIECWLDMQRVEFEEDE